MGLFLAIAFLLFIFFNLELGRLDYKREERHYPSLLEYEMEMPLHGAFKWQI